MFSFSENFRPLLPVLKCLSEDQQKEFLQEFLDLAVKEHLSQIPLLAYMITKE